MMEMPFHDDCIIRRTGGVLTEVHFDGLTYKIAMQIAILIAFWKGC